MARILARADIVKLSTADQAYLGFDVAAPVVVVTDAGGPVRVRVGGEAHEVPVPAVEVVDTVGAGDTFGGAMLAWLVDAGITRATVADRGCRAGRRALRGQGVGDRLPTSGRRPADPCRPRRLVTASPERPFMALYSRGECEIGLGHAAWGPGPSAEHEPHRAPCQVLAT